MKKLVLSLAFVGFGAFAMAQQTPVKPTPEKEQMHAKKAQMKQKRAEMEKKHMDEMVQELNLTPAQVAQIKALHEKEKADRESNMENMHKEMKGKMEQHDAEMKKILNADQYAKWKAKKQEMMMKKREKFQDFKGKGQRKGQHKQMEDSQEQN